jgi:hypothetical protein
MPQHMHGNSRLFSRRPWRKGRHAHRRERRAVTALALAALGLFALLLYATLAPASTAAAWSTKQISAKALADHECNSTEWHFVITQVDTEAHAAASIHVTWANGSSENVALDKFTGGVAHYVTTANLDSTVVSATAQIYAGWSGQFNLSHGPCGTSSNSPPPPTKTTCPTKTPPPTNTTSHTTPPPTKTTSHTKTPPPTMTTSHTKTPPPTKTSSTTSAPSGSTSVSGSVSVPGSTPAAGSSGSAMTSAAAVAANGSPFVPGPGLTGDSHPYSGLPLKQILLGAGLVLLGTASLLSIQLLRRRGEHS